MFLNCWLAKHALENMIVSWGARRASVWPTRIPAWGAACHTPSPGLSALTTVPGGPGDH